MDMGNRKDVVAIVILFVAVDTTTLIWRGWYMRREIVPLM
jgi:hypothetical protein